MNCLKVFLLFSLLLTVCYSYKILGIFLIPTGSHYILAKKLFKDIAKRGHEVTFITPYRSKEKIENLKEIPLEGLQTVFKNIASTVSMENTTPFEKAVLVNNLNVNFTQFLLSSTEFQTLLNSGEKFDGVVLYQYLNEALYPIASHFNASLILFSSMPLYVSESFLLKHPTPSSYVPNILTEYTGRMNFWQRLRNSFYDVCMILYYQWSILPKHRELAFKYIPGRPDVHDFLTNASLVLINSHVSTNEALPLVPNAVEIGGYHIEEPKPFPDHLQKFLDESKNGVILFSMGSIARSADFAKDKQEALMKAFSKLKENVLWKWEDDELPNKPKNVKIMKWVPQSDVLAHPNVKAFISHGGLLSTMESVYYGKPIIGIPIFADQKMNIALATSYEYAVEVPYQKITEKTVLEALDQILNNPKYKENILQRSNIMHDRPMRPSDSALYWIEYVIRHKGATHLKYPGMDLNWMQRNLLDVSAFVAATALIIILVILSSLKLICRRKTKQKRE